VKGHIKLLHEFNEVRDVGLGLIGFFLPSPSPCLFGFGGDLGTNGFGRVGKGMVSENRGTRVQNVMRGLSVP